MLGEKETFKFLDLLEENTMKNADIFFLIEKKNISGERENYSKPNYIAEISLKG